MEKGDDWNFNWKEKNAARAWCSQDSPTPRRQRVTQKRRLEPMAGRNSSGRFTISGSLWAWVGGGNLVPTGSSQGDITASAKAHSLQSQPLLTKTYLEFVECHRLGVNSSKHPHPSLQNLSEWISYHHRLTLCWMILLRCVKGDSSLRYQLMPSFCYLYLERWCCKSAALNMPANLENTAVATGLEKISFHSNPKKRQCQRRLKLLHNCIHLTR